MNSVVAKFKVTSIEDFGTNKTAKLSALYDPNGANKDFTAATPYGHLEIGISGDVSASEFFKAGDVVILTFTKE